MPRLILLRRERASENGVWMDNFIANDSVINAEQAMREAVLEFLQTDAGKTAIRYTCGDFNWGDALDSVPDEIWSKHGITVVYDNQEQNISVSGRIINITVNQDEVLCSDLDDEEQDFVA